MTNIYLIQAHQYPHQLKRLIEKLDSEYVFFYIHIDLKSDIRPFKDVIKGENIMFIEKRVDCIWGDFSQVQATLNLCEEVVNHEFARESRITLLSGQDYPIKTNEYIDTFLKYNKDINFINIEKIDINRIHHLKNLKAFKINHSSKRFDFTLISRYHYRSILKALLNRKISINELKFLFQKKELPLNMIPYRGAQWWSFNYKIFVKVFTFYQNHRDALNEFFKNTFCPDEIFFHTILMHLKNKDQSIKIDGSLTYDNWERKGVDLPVTFELDDYEELMSQSNKKLFARKFDSIIDNNILNKLDGL